MSGKNIRSFFLFPIFPVLLLLGLGLNSSAHSGILPGHWSMGVEGGVNKLTEGYWDYSNLDMFGGITVGRTLSQHWNGKFALRYGQVRPGVDSPESEAGWGFDSSTNLYTVMWQPQGLLQYRFAPQSSVCPTMSIGLGFTSWKVLDTSADDFGLFASGDIVHGFDINGEEKELSGSELTISLELGLDYYVTDSIALSVGGRYHLMPGNELDNIGLSYLWGADHVDANTAMAQGFLGVTMWFGNSDWDKDGINNKEDQCPTVAEDFDGFQDEDGCPELDNDGDGVLDYRDMCPETPAGATVDQKGCTIEIDVISTEVLNPAMPSAEIPVEVAPEVTIPAAKPIPAAPVAKTVAETSVVYAEDSSVLKGVSFVIGSAQLTPESIAILAGVAAQLRTAPEEVFEIRGHTDSSGNTEDNRDLSMQRAISVRDSLIQMGVKASRLTAVGYGEDFPLESNATSEGREKNRRVELHKVN